MRRCSILAAALVAGSGLLAQEPPPQQPPPTPPPQTAPQPPAPQPPALQPPAPQPPAPAPEPATPPPVSTPLISESGGVSRESLPYFNLYLPEGQASVRLRKLIKNVLFESQIDYRFINGDISTFLRYKYYARDYTYKIGVFDSIGFPDIGHGSSQDFQRVRGGLLLFELPRNYNNRYYWLVQDDRLTFGDVTDVDNRKNNIYTKVAYQYGTLFDEHLNGIVGESRGRIIPVLTAFQDLGPQKTSFAAAVTEAARISTGDYRYTKFEAEGVRRWDLTPASFMVTRAHFGTFPAKSTIRGTDYPQIERYSVPAYEMFPLGGRQALLSIGSSDAATGTSEFNISNEYFVPVFRNRDYKTWLMHWNTLYGIGYLGAGNVGYQLSDIGRFHDFALDAGLGTETSVTIRDFEVLLSVVFAHTIRAPDDLKGNKVRFSIRTIR